MPGKHHGKSFASRHRQPLVIAVVLLCLTVAGVLVAAQNRREPAAPLLITPALPPLTSPSAVPVPVLDSPSPSPSASSGSASAARSPSRPARPSPSATGGSFTASYTVTNDRKSFQAAISVTNGGRTARSWRVVVAHDPDDGVRLKGTAGARVTTAGETITFSGDGLDPASPSRSATRPRNAPATTCDPPRAASTGWNVA